MQCNIDASGRRTRILAGIASCTFAMATGICAALIRQYWQWLAVAAIALLLLGAFQIFEGMVGWCAVRAMGIRTKL